MSVLCGCTLNQKVIFVRYAVVYDKWLCVYVILLYIYDKGLYVYVMWLYMYDKWL